MDVILFPCCWVFVDEMSGILECGLCGGVCVGIWFFCSAYSRVSVYCRCGFSCCRGLDSHRSSLVLC